MKSEVVAEAHDFLVDVLDAAKAAEIRRFYEQRRLITPAGHLVLRTDVPGRLIDDLAHWAVGPRRLHWHPEPENHIAHSVLADYARRDGAVGGFWFDEREAELWRALGIETHLTPERMIMFNDKVWLRRMAAELGLENSLPMNRICHTVDQMLAAESEIMFTLRRGHPVPDFAMGKIGYGLSGAGMEFFRTNAERQKFYADYVDGTTPIICEAAWDASRVTVLSVHFDVHVRCIHRAGHTLNVIANGCNHTGNTIVRGPTALPGVSFGEIDRAYQMCLPFVQHMRHAHGLIGKIGFDMIRVVDIFGASRWYIIEANALRPPAPRYGMALGETIAPRLNGRWGISMVEVPIAPGAAHSYDELVRLMRHPRWGSLYFNGATGVIPLLTDLLDPRHGKPKFIAVCVGENTEQSLLLLDRLRFLVGKPQHHLAESHLHRLPDWEAVAFAA